MKRLIDFSLSFIGLIILGPFLLIVLFLVWVYDFHNPLYRPIRSGKDGSVFRMVKFRTMVVDADKVGPTSTSGRDPRITPIGHFIRKFKLDEFTQLWNVLVGDMSLVGPRPQVKSHVDECYTKEEMQLLEVRPGITDFASIVFSDEGDILKDSIDADLDYNRLIRPWKSRLGIFYIQNMSVLLDIKLIYLTVVAILSKENALVSLSAILKQLNASDELVKVSSRKKLLVPSAPPGALEPYCR
jgi:lipopolysaccharide/colanic/teichoic acid biosynthesis glycosyltransferase